MPFSWGSIGRFQEEISEKSRELMSQKKDKYLIIEEIIDLSLSLIAGKTKLPENDDHANTTWPSRNARISKNI